MGDSSGALPIGQVHSGRVTRVVEFGAFVELEPGIEALAHASTFPPTSRAGDWAKSVAVGMTAAFEILTVDPAQKRIGIKLIEEGSARASAATGVPSDDHAEEPQPSMGSLADSLRNALKGR